MRFEFSQTEFAKFQEWKKEVYAKGVALQKETITDPGEHHLYCWEEGFPYCGAIGGQFTYEFTPTSIGVIIVVKDAITDEKIDLTDYGMF